MGPGGNPQANMVPGRMAGPPQAAMMQGMQGNPQGGPMYQSGDMKGWPQGAMQRNRYMHKRLSQNTHPLQSTATTKAFMYDGHSFYHCQWYNLRQWFSTGLTIGHTAH